MENFVLTFVAHEDENRPALYGCKTYYHVFILPPFCICVVLNGSVSVVLTVFSRVNR